MRVRHGHTIETAIAALDRIIDRSEQPRGASSGESLPQFNDYLNWIDAAQVQLRVVFADREIEDCLLSRGYWHIVTTLPADNYLSRMINEEMVFQAGNLGVPADSGGRLGEFSSRLKRLRRLADRPGDIYVTDTNALLHYTRFDKLNWAKRIGVESVRLVIPLAVIDELDAKKYSRREEFQKTARNLLAVINRLTTINDEAYAKISNRLTVEVLPDEEGHLRAPSTDQEILERCELLAQVTDRPVTLITGDSGVRINARSRGMNVFQLTEDDLLPSRMLPASSEDETQ